MLEENIERLCRRYTQLSPDDIDEIRRIAGALPFLADTARADVFINCPCGDGNSIIVAHASPADSPSLYREKTIGLFSYPVSEPAVDRTLRLGIETRYVTAVSQEGRRVVQRAVPINRNGRTVGVLTYEQKPDDGEMILRKDKSPGRTESVPDTEPPAIDIAWLFEEAVDAALLIIDNNGFVVYRNRRAKELYRSIGYVEDILGQSYRNIDFFRSEELDKDGTQEIQIQDRYFRSRIMAVNRDDIAFAVFLNDITSSKETAKELILKSMAVQEMHHRIKNNLQTIVSLINLQIRRSGSREVRENMRVISDRIQTIAMTHQLLSQNVSDAKVSLRKVIANIANNVIRSETTVCQIRLTQGGDDIVIDSDTATTIALVINELIQNAIDHAFPDRSTGHVSIDVIRKSASYCSIVVRDDGKGVSETDPQNLGSHIIRAMVREKLRGSLVVEGSDEGTTVTVSFPIFD